MLFSTDKILWKKRKSHKCHMASHEALILSWYGSLKSSPLKIVLDHTLFNNFRLQIITIEPCSLVVLGKK